MTAKRKMAQKRLTLLQLAERLRNVSEDCRHHAVSRSQFSQTSSAEVQKLLKILKKEVSRLEIKIIHTDTSEFRKFPQVR